MNLSKFKLKQIMDLKLNLEKKSICNNDKYLLFYKIKQKIQ